jgi:hypothetical protein
MVPPHLPLRNNNSLKRLGHPAVVGFWVNCKASCRARWLPLAVVWVAGWWVPAAVVTVGHNKGMANKGMVNKATRNKDTDNKVTAEATEVAGWWAAEWWALLHEDREWEPVRISFFFAGLVE